MGAFVYVHVYPARAHQALQRVQRNGRRARHPADPSRGQAARRQRAIDRPAWRLCRARIGRQQPRDDSAVRACGGDVDVRHGDARQPSDRDRVVNGRTIDHREGRRSGGRAAHGRYFVGSAERADELLGRRRGRIVIVVAGGSDYDTECGRQWEKAKIEHGRHLNVVERLVNRPGIKHAIQTLVPCPDSRSSR